jgi:hypothetical protein
MELDKRKKEIIADVIAAVRKFRFCGPSDDPDEQTAVTAGYRHLVIQLKRLAGPILPPAAASQLSAIDVEINNLFSAYDEAPSHLAGKRIEVRFDPLDLTKLAALMWAT